MARGNRLPVRLDSRQHDLPFIQSLLDRKVREQTALFWAEGCRNLHHALGTGRRIHVLAYCRKLLRSHSSELAVRHLQRSGSPILELDECQFRSLSRQEEPQGVGVVTDQSWHPLIDIDPGPKDLWVVLDNVQTPGNLGTILRTCAAAGAQGVMLIGGETDPHDPASVRSSMGAIFHQKLVRTSAKSIIGWRLRHRCNVVGTCPSATKCYRHADYRRPLLLMMGNERHGLRERQRSLCDTLVRLPMTDRVDSLNLAVATGVMLYEAVAQHA